MTAPERDDPGPDEPPGGYIPQLHDDLDALTEERDRLRRLVADIHARGGLGPSDPDADLWRRVEREVEGAGRRDDG